MMHEPRASPAETRRRRGGVNMKHNEESSVPQREDCLTGIPRCHPPFIPFRVFALLDPRLTRFRVFHGLQTQSHLPGRIAVGNGVTPYRSPSSFVQIRAHSWLKIPPTPASCDLQIRQISADTGPGVCVAGWAFQN